MKNFHYGLEFVLNASPEEVDAKIKQLKGNRIRVTDRDRRFLKIGLRERMKVRQRSAENARQRYMK